MRSSRVVLPLAALLVGGLAACADDPVAPTMPTVLDGLAASSAHDSTGTPLPDPGPGSGQVHGTVLGPSAPGSGNDSLETAPRIVGATITAYPVIADGPLTLDDPVATVVTGSDGRFELPLLPNGEYVVTVEPPDDDIHWGQWIRASIGAGSGDHPWWVVLAKR